MFQNLIVVNFKSLKHDELFKDLNNITAEVQNKYDDSIQNLNDHKAAQDIKLEEVRKGNIQCINTLSRDLEGVDQELESINNKLMLENGKNENFQATVCENYSQLNQQYLNLVNSTTEISDEFNDHNDRLLDVEGKNTDNLVTYAKLKYVTDQWNRINDQKNRAAHENTLADAARKSADIVKLYT